MHNHNPYCLRPLGMGASSCHSWSQGIRVMVPVGVRIQQACIEDWVAGKVQRSSDSMLQEQVTTRQVYKTE